jgi:2-desacetyl-2-hydroxyethyl bacteriochlorophyllide A dehydrogenase
LEVALIDVEVAPPQEGQILVQTEWSGISSGTEMLAYRGQIHPNLPLDETIGALGGTFRYPFRYGYSVVGRVEDSRAPSVPPGAAVFAFHPHQDLVVVDAADAIQVDGVEPRVATLLPLVETAFTVCLDAAPRLGEVALVIGLGSIGILAAALLTRAGAQVIASEPLAERRRLAASLGVTSVAPEQLGDAVVATTDGRGADVAVEASGNPQALAACLPLLGREGSVVVASWYGSKPVTLPLGAGFHRRRLSIRSSQVSTLPAAATARWDRRRRLQVVRRLLDELPLGALATHDFPFDEAPSAFAAVARGEPGLIHAALRYGPRSHIGTER